jgi:hypothetical protein
MAEEGGEQVNVGIAVFPHLVTNYEDDMLSFKIYQNSLGGRLPSIVLSLYMYIWGQWFWQSFDIALRNKVVDW